MKGPSDLAARRRVIATLVVAAVWLTVVIPFLLGAVQCPTARLMHQPCPGCGMTRAFLLLAAGDVRASLAMHPLAVPTAAVQAALAIASVVASWQTGAPWALFEARWGRRILFALVTVMALDFLLWIARGVGAFGGPVPI